MTHLYQNMGIHRTSNYNRRQPMKSGAIYIAHNPRDGKDTFKVGKTQRSPEERMKELTSETSNLGEYIVKSYFAVEDIDAAERACHERLSIYRIQKNREFFELPFPQLLQIVKKAITPFSAIDYVSESEMDNTTSSFDNPFDKNSYKDQFPQPEYKPNECLTSNDKIISQGIFRCFYCDTKNRIDSFNENRIPVCSACKIKPFDKERFKLLCRLHSEKKTLKIVTAWIKFRRSKNKIAIVVVCVILVLAFELIVGF